MKLSTVIMAAGKGKRMSLAAPVLAESAEGTVEGGKAVAPGAGDVQRLANAQMEFLLDRAGTVPEGAKRG